MTEKEIHNLVEVQYLYGRLDELHKAFIAITNMNNSRKIDQRLDKYYNKLKNTNEMAYHLYQVQRETSRVFQNKSKLRIKTLLQASLVHIDSQELKKDIKKQIDSYT
tara:strand:- start:1542 stop:1862 length:321 start_codon:yes stop_codon:yes gene_type:complete